jgi:hypothetical protein
MQSTFFVSIPSQVKGFTAAVICSHYVDIIRGNQAAARVRHQIRKSALSDRHIMEFRSGKVIHETQYFAEPFEAPHWRSQGVENGS